MSDHYTRTASFSKGALARGDSTQNEFDLVETGFDGLEAEVDQSLRFTAGDFTASGDFTISPYKISTSALNRTNRVLGCSSDGTALEFKTIASLGLDLTAASADEGKYVSVDSNGNWTLTAFDFGANNYLITNSLLAPHTGLSVSRASATTATISATTMIVAGSSNKTLSSVSVTADITASGANGLDTGAEATSTWYYLWVINNGTTTAALLSTSSSAPTMPSGYSYKGMVGAVYNDSGGDFDPFSQKNKTVAITDTVVASASPVTITSVDLSTVAPSEASEWVGYMKTTGVAGQNFYVAADSTNDYGQLFVHCVDNTYNAVGTVVLPLLTAQTAYYKASNAGLTNSLNATGYRW